MDGLLRNRLIRGGVEGVAATAIMTGVIGLARLTGLIRTPPPKHITARVGEKIGIRPHAAPKPAFHATWLAAHVGYGAASGVAYSLLRPLLPASPLAAGLIYGVALWGVGYLGYLPALGLYPWPEEDSTSRTIVMVAAHGVYGISMAEAEERSR